MSDTATSASPYVIRTLTEDDRTLIEAYIAAEADHSNNTFEFYRQPGTKSVLYEDSEGPLFVVKYSPALRVDIEFSNTAGPDRIRKALADGFPEVDQAAKDQGFKELIFNSVSTSLTKFFSAFGFEASPNEFRKLL